MTVSREIHVDGRFVRPPSRFTDGFTAEGPHPPEAGRYQLYASLACPWAQRTLIVRRLLGIEDVIGLTIVDPIRDERGWRFTLSPGDRDPVTGVSYLSELYLASDPSFEGRYTVPCIWDTMTGRLVTNDFKRMTVQFETEFTAFHAPDAPDLYPEERRKEIDEITVWIYETLNNGVYRTGFARTQEAYDEALPGVFATLDALDERLASRRYLVGDALTDADVRLYTTLARFDAVYFAHFKCSLRRLADYPAVWAYARDLYQRPAFRETTDFDHIKWHYYGTQRDINPFGIVPAGPLLDWEAPHDRDPLP